MKKLDQLGPIDLAIIEYLYNLSSPPCEPLPLFDRAVRGVSHFMVYVAETAHEPGVLSFLPSRSVKDALTFYGSHDALGQHVLEVVMQKVIQDEEHTSETHRYTTPLVLPQNSRSEVAAHIPRFTLYIHLCDLIFGGIEGVVDELKRTIGRFVGIKVQSAIQKHYRSSPKKPKS